MKTFITLLPVVFGAYFAWLAFWLFRIQKLAQARIQSNTVAELHKLVVDLAKEVAELKKRVDELRPYR